MSTDAAAVPGISRSPEEILSMDLPSLGARQGATQGEPHESLQEIANDGRVQVGVWECTAGGFPSARDGISEVMHFVAGDGTLYDEDGTAREIKPGAVIVVQDGWRGRWEIRETVRKTYTVVQSA
jgi:hypothetical protein